LEKRGSTFSILESISPRSLRGTPPGRAVWQKRETWNCLFMAVVEMGRLHEDRACGIQSFVWLSRFAEALSEFSVKKDDSWLAVGWRCRFLSRC
jgi:hypothetical protein